MPRTSPVHYINPSAISLTANANGSTNDIAVYIDRNAKIKVYSPKVGLNLSSGDYQEWSLRGRNRRLENSAKKYAIYARLRHNDHEDGYLVFAAMEQYTEGPRAGQWYEKYWHVGPEGWEGGYEDEDGWAVIEPDPTYWYIKLGEVSLPENHQRTIDLDTGILGTEQFNTEWALNPDALPLRIEFSCTINDDDAGPTPYVYWGQTLLLVAMLTEGWNGTDIERFDHWEITRDTGNALADATWAADVNPTDFRTTVSINLMHGRGAGQGVRDDFNSAVNTTFTVNAMERTDDPEQGGTPTYAVLKSASICIMAETWEKYELSLAAQMVTYNPITQSYSPNNGVKFNIRATDQKSNTFLMTNKQVGDAGLVAEYAVIDTDSWTSITISGPDNNVAEGTVPATAFSTNQQSINVRLKNGAGTELFRTTIAFLRDGEDSKEREWIFLRSTEAITFGTQEHPYPASISGGQVNPTGAATGSDTNKDQDGWVPEGWWDEQQGVDATNRFEYGAYRDFVHESGNTPAHWGAFTTPKIWNHYGKDGQNSIRLALDNVHEDFLYDDAGTLIAPSGGARSEIHLYDGNTEKRTELVRGTTLVIDRTRSSGVPFNSVGEPTINSSYILTVPKILDGYETAKVVVKATYNGQDYYADFTANKTNQDKYDLVVDPSSIVYNSAIYQQKRIKVYADVTTLAGGTSKATISTTSDSGTLRLFATYGGNTVQVTDNITEDGVKKLYIDITSAIAGANDGIYLELRKYSGSSYVVKDYETVEIAKAENGTSPWVAGIDKSMDSIQCDVNGNVVTPQNAEVNLSLSHGSEAQSFKIAGIKRNSTVIDRSEAITTMLFAIDGQRFNSLPSDAATAHSLTIHYYPGTTINSKDDIEITLTDANGDNQKALHLIVNGIRPGADGDDAVNVVVSPASMIVEQDINNKNNIAHAADNNLGQFSIQVLKGSTPACNITSITVSASQVYMSESASTGEYTGDNCRTWTPSVPQLAAMYLKGIAKDSQDNYYTTGQITLSITYTDPDTNTSKTITGIIARVYVNLIGTWSEEVVGDAKTEVAKSLSYAYDPTGHTVISLENMGQFIKSSTQYVSELQQKIYVDILNLTYPATSSSIDGTTLNITAGTYRVIGDFNISRLPTGNGYLTFVGPGVNKTWDLTGGLVDSIDDEVTFTSAGVLTISAGDDVSSGSAYDILNLAIYQSQDKIAKLELTADGLTSDVSAIKAGKNLLSGTLTGSGWYKGTAGSRGIVAEAITDDDVDNGRISVGNKQYLLSTDCNFVADKSYTLSFQNDDVTMLYVGIAYGSLSASPFEYFAITKNSDGRFVHTFAITQSNSYRLCIDFDENSIASANRYIYHPMFEEGTEATAFDAGDTEVSSQIKQEADNIELKVKNGLNEVGISILGTENKIVLDADTTEIKNGSQTAAMFQNGKIMAAYIDAVTVVANALVSSTINADNATINNLKLVNAEVSGKIVANLMLSPTNIISQTGNIERKYTIDLISNPCSAFLCYTENAKLKIMLPKAADYDGIELSFYYDRNYTSSYGAVYVFQNSNETSGVKKIRSRKWNVLTSQEGVQFEAPDPEYYNDPSSPSSNNPFYANAVLLGFNQSITFKSMGSTWYVINGRVADASGTSW